MAVMQPEEKLAFSGAFVWSVVGFPLVRLALEEVFGEVSCVKQSLVYADRGLPVS